jgi:NitT/TauT family transport system ATP-binding protein
MSLETRSINKTFFIPRSEEAIRVLLDISFQAEEGQFVSIVGPSGCGKTTLLRIISGLEQATEGKVILDGAILAGRDPRIGLVFQESALFPWRTALQNIEFGLEILKKEKKARQAAAGEYLQAFGLAGFGDKYPEELSSGMRQRVAIARTLMTNPKVLLMDEPFGFLDSQTRISMQNFLLKVWEEKKVIIIFVTHNVDEAVFLSDKVLVLSEKPARVVKTIEIDLPRPRDRVSSETYAIQRKILNLLAQQ